MGEATKTKRNWREEPGPNDYYMSADEFDMEPTIIPASTKYNHDRHRLARALDCGYTEVRVETYYLAWDPETAEAEWRQDRCECEDGPHYTGPLIKRSTGEPIPPEECATTKPAEDVYDFWDETGRYCPWVPCKASTDGAVKFRRGSVR